MSASVSDATTLSDTFEAIRSAATTSGRRTPSIGLAETQHLADAHSLAVGDVERAALRARVVPERYVRNLGTVGWDGQCRLLEATVAVVGAGGLGGWAIEGLARMGVGHLIIIDGDVFGENNLNRQLGCTEACLGQPKACCMGERVRQVNRAVQVTVHRAWLNTVNAPELLSGADVVVDALDTLPGRFELQEAAAALGLPLVHGAIAGFTGQVMTILPGDAGLRALYGARPPTERGVETSLGNPAATPMMIASWQVQEAVKLITGVGRLVRNRMLILDAEDGDVTELSLGS